MTAYSFYKWFGTFIEILPILPFMIGCLKWYSLTKPLKVFILFFLAECCLNLCQNYFFFNNSSNLFLYYFYSFFNNLFLLYFYFMLFENRLEKGITIALFSLNNLFLLIDWLFISKFSYNFYSNFFINFIIFIVSVYFFLAYFSKPKYQNSKVENIYFAVSIVSTFLFFVRLVNVIFDKVLLETQYNATFWLFEKILYNYFMLIFILFYSLSLYSYKQDEN